MPLTLAQLDFWEEFTLHPGLPVSTVAHCLDIEGAVDRVALINAVVRTVQEADVLSIRFQPSARDGVPLQCCDPMRVPELRTIDFRQSPDPMRSAEEIMRADVEAPLDLLSEPLTAHWLFQVGESRYLWYIRGHHIVLDGFGMGLIEQRCGQLYTHFLSGADAGESFPPFSKYLAEEESYRVSERCQHDGDFWRRYLDSPIALPVLRKGGEDYGEEGHHAEAELPAEWCERLCRLAVDTGIGWPDLLVMLSGAYLFLHLPTQDLGDQRALPIWLPFMSRWGSVSAYIPALVVNILPLVVTVEADETLDRFLHRMERVLRQQRAHGRYRIEQIDADQGLPDGSRYFFSPLVNVLPFDPPLFDGCRVKRSVLSSGPGDGFNVTFRGRSDGSGLVLSLDVDLSISRRAFDLHWQQLRAFLVRALMPSALSGRVEECAARNN